MSDPTCEAVNGNEQPGCSHVEFTDSSLIFQAPEADEVDMFVKVDSDIEAKVKQPISQHITIQFS